MTIGIQILRIAVGIVFLILSASITLDVPGTSIPVSAQSLVVFLVAYLLGWPKGILAIIAYLVLGGLGLPVFADGNSGWPTFSGGSGGFLIGFALSGSFLSWFAEKKYNQWTTNLLAFTLATIILLFSGNFYLTYLYGFEKALQFGFWPFWPGAIIKIILSVLVVAAYKSPVWVIKK